MESGPAAVTVRALSVSIRRFPTAPFTTLSARVGLVVQAWLRAARRFLDMQDEIVASVLRRRIRPEAAINAAVAAADAPAQFAMEHPVSGRILRTVSCSELLGHLDTPADSVVDLPEGLAADL